MDTVSGVDTEDMEEEIQNEVDKVIFYLIFPLCYQQFFFLDNEPTLCECTEIL